MSKYPAPTPPFIGARYHGGSQTPRAIVMHATVSPDDPGTARNIAKWWAGPTSPKSSAHYIVDPRETIQAVGDHTIAWHCGYNTGSIGVELCDEQTGPATRWQDADSKAILARAATLVAQLCLAYGIEPVRPSIADLRRKGPHGIYGHDDSRRAFGNTTHTDPRDFDWPAFLRLVRAEIARLSAPKEQPVKKIGKPTRRGVGKNIKGSRGRTRAGRRRIVDDLKILTDDNPMFVALLETPGALSAIRAALGRRYKRVGSKAPRSTRLYAHERVRVLRATSVRFRTFWRGPQGGLHRGRKWQGALLSYDDKVIDVLAMHQVWGRGKNRKAWDEGLRKIEQYTKNHPDVPMLIGCDWNMAHDHPDATRLAKRIGGVILPGADPDWWMYRPAPEGSKYDRPIRPRVNATPKRGSDHHGTTVDPT